MQGCVGSDVIYAERRGQSQKPEEIYQLIEELVPGGSSHCSPQTFHCLVRTQSHLHLPYMFTLCVCPMAIWLQVC